MSYSDFAENRINDAICNAISFSVAQLYVKLHIADPGENGTDAPAANTVRKAVTFTLSSGGSCSNDTDIFWTLVPAAETYTHVSFWDSPTAGNCWGTSAITTPVAVTAGDTAQVAVGALTLTTT